MNNFKWGELLIVILIVSILLAVVLPKILGW